ncbi:MAG: hypothetical protein MUO72_03575 [Bacteroidales bacterium]|nr:hypothetical protein [Bacteroidales bacterium]
MNRKSIKLVVSFILTMIFSCDEPETVITNIVHPDGSVTRKIEMKSVKNNFEVSNLQVPFDPTWNVKDSLEFTEKGDTIWVKRAEKLFKNIDEINRAYQADSGANKDISRRTEFRKKFKWFNTEYRFAEIIDKKISYGYLVTEFLNQEELQWFYSPENITDEKKNGPDSLKFKVLDDTVNKKIDRWFIKCLASEWIGEFAKLTEGKAGDELTLGSLKAKEDEFVKIIETSGEKFDSLWSEGILLKEFIGEANAMKYSNEADSANNFAADHVLFDFLDYTVRISMPGKLIGTNGFIDSTRISLWPVKSDYFVTQPYEMWAESRTPNRWAWIVSGVFLVFVLAGIIFRMLKKK